MNLDLDALRSAFGLGVAGNFAGHLEQAGEAGDFASVDAPAAAPKGIFPWYAPRSTTFLSQFPLSSDRTVLPPSDTPLHLQIEPEVAVLFQASYDADGAVGGLTATGIAAFNDCSIRRPGAAKISHKKNWGPASKGLARTGFAVTEIEPDGATADLRLACFLRRGERVDAYGVDSPVPGYTYYGSRLVDWLVDRLRRQHGAPDTPLEDVGALLRENGCPPLLVVGIGATRYTTLGESTFLEAGDASVVIVYDASCTTPEGVARAVERHEEDALPRASVLRQTVS